MKINKVIGVCLAGITVLCSGVASADVLEPIAICPGNQYMAGNVCEACPEHATCNGSSVTCNEGYVAKVEGKYTTCVKRTTGPIAKPKQPKGHFWGTGLKRR